MCSYHGICIFVILGFGEQGIPVKIDPKDLDKYEDLYKVNGFNAALSDKIALDRAVPDIRHKGYEIFLVIIFISPTYFLTFTLHTLHYNAGYLHLKYVHTSFSFVFQLSAEKIPQQA